MHIRLTLFLFHWFFMLRCRVRYVFKGWIELESMMQMKIRDAHSLTNWPLIGWLVSPVKWLISFLCHEFECFQLGHIWCRWKKTDGMECSYYFGFILVSNKSIIILSCYDRTSSLLKKPFLSSVAGPMTSCSNINPLPP